MWPTGKCVLYFMSLLQGTRRSSGKQTVSYGEMQDNLIHGRLFLSVPECHWSWNLHKSVRSVVVAKTVEWLMQKKNT